MSERECEWVYSFVRLSSSVGHHSLICNVLTTKYECIRNRRFPGHGTDNVVTAGPIFQSWEMWHMK